MTHLLTYWYLQSPARTYHAFLHLISLLEGTWAIRATAFNLNKPLFQDYTLSGRMIGLGLRIARILGGLAVYALIAALYLIGYLVWLFFPFICVAAIIGAFLGPAPVQVMSPAIGGSL